MRRSLALSLLAALTGSTFAEPTTTAPSRTGNAKSSQNQIDPVTELTEKQQIVQELRHVVGRELRED